MMPFRKNPRPAKNRNVMWDIVRETPVSLKAIKRRGMPTVLRKQRKPYSAVLKKINVYPMHYGVLMCIKRVVVPHTLQERMLKEFRP